MAVGDFSGLMRQLALLQQQNREGPVRAATQLGQGISQGAGAIADQLRLLAQNTRQDQLIKQNQKFTLDRDKNERDFRAGRDTAAATAATAKGEADKDKAIFTLQKAIEAAKFQGNTELVAVLQQRLNQLTGGGQAGAAVAQGEPGADRVRRVVQGLNKAPLFSDEEFVGLPSPGPGRTTRKQSAVGRAQAARAAGEFGGLPAAATDLPKPPPTPEGRRTLQDRALRFEEANPTRMNRPAANLEPRTFAERGFPTPPAAPGQDTGFPLNRPQAVGDQRVVLGALKGNEDEVLSGTKTKNARAFILSTIQGDLLDGVDEEAALDAAMARQADDIKMERIFKGKKPFRYTRSQLRTFIRIAVRHNAAR